MILYRQFKIIDRRKMKNYTDVAVTRNYSLTMLHISKVSDMAQRLGIPQGEVVRNAIDLYYEQLESTEAQAETEPAAEG